MFLKRYVSPKSSENFSITNKIKSKQTAKMAFFVDAQKLIIIELQIIFLIYFSPILILTSFIRRTFAAYFQIYY